jgi:transcriptional regulator with XRE-family HTH domain
MTLNRDDSFLVRKAGKMQKAGVARVKPRSSIEKSRSKSVDEEPSIILQVASMVAKAIKFAARTGGASVKIGKALLTSSADDKKMIQETGEYLKDVRELAGLTRAELAEALNLSDQSLLAAVEKGTATLSFELILRLAALLARHDPLPFIIKFTKAYDPEIWDILEKWGIGRIPVHFQRERQFINIYRGNDAARKLSDEGFEEVLDFTRASFEMALHFVHKQDKNLKNISRSRQDKKMQKSDPQEGKN